MKIMNHAYEQERVCHQHWSVISRRMHVITLRAALHRATNKRHTDVGGGKKKVDTTMISEAHFRDDNMSHDADAVRLHVQREFQELI